MDYQKLIKTFTKEDFVENRVNLHIHTTYSDGEGDFTDIVTQAHASGYEYIAFADHNTMQGYVENGIPEGVIPAVEFDCWHGYVFLHLLGYGVDFNNEVLSQFFAKNKRETEWDIVRIFTPHRAKLIIDAIHKAGGLAVLAHPACCWCVNMEQFVKDLMKYGLDGLEVYYPYERHRGIIKFHSRQTVEKIADKYGLVKTGGTDLHGKIL